MSDFTHLIPMSASTYSSKIRRYENTGHAEEVLQDEENFFYNSFLTYVKSADPIHINRILIYAKHSGQYRRFRKILTGLVAHTWEKNNSPVLVAGKGVKANKNQLRRLRLDGEQRFFEAFSEIKKPAKRVRIYDLSKRLTVFLELAEKNGYSVQDVMNQMIESNPIGLPESPPDNVVSIKSNEPTLEQRNDALMTA